MRIIAEIGSNWKTTEDCLKSIYTAKKLGADVVKFQWFSNECLYGEAGIRSNLPPVEILSKECDNLGIEFMCTAFSPTGYGVVNPFVQRHKIASSEITAIDILERVNSFKKPVLLSTGGASFEQIETALNKLTDCMVTLLYCVTDYPARIVDFRNIELMREHFGSQYQYGYSDHSTDVLNIPRLAKQHGSVILEKHVNFTDHTDTPDAPHSLNAKEFGMMIKSLKGQLSIKDTFIPCTWQRVKTEHGYFRPRV